MSTEYSRGTQHRRTKGWRGNPRIFTRNGSLLGPQSRQSHPLLSPCRPRPVASAPCFPDSTAQTGFTLTVLYITPVSCSQEITSPVYTPFYRATERGSEELHHAPLHVSVLQPWIHVLLYRPPSGFIPSLLHGLDAALLCLNKPVPSFPEVHIVCC